MNNQLLIILTLAVALCLLAAERAMLHLQQQQDSEQAVIVPEARLFEQCSEELKTSTQEHERQQRHLQQQIEAAQSKASALDKTLNEVQSQVHEKSLGPKYSKAAADALARGALTCIPGSVACALHPVAERWYEEVALSHPSTADVARAQSVDPEWIERGRTALVNSASAFMRDSADNSLQEGFVFDAAVSNAGPACPSDEALRFNQSWQQQILHAIERSRVLLREPGRPVHIQGCAPTIRASSGNLTASAASNYSCDSSLEVGFSVTDSNYADMAPAHFSMMQSVGHGTFFYVCTDEKCAHTLCALNIPVVYATDAYERKKTLRFYPDVVKYEVAAVLAARGYNHVFMEMDVAIKRPLWSWLTQYQEADLFGAGHEDNPNHLNIGFWYVKANAQNSTARLFDEAAAMSIRHPAEFSGHQWVLNCLLFGFWCERGNETRPAWVKETVNVWLFPGHVGQSSDAMWMKTETTTLHTLNSYGGAFSYSGFKRIALKELGLWGPGHDYYGSLPTTDAPAGKRPRYLVLGDTLTTSVRHYSYNRAAGMFSMLPLLVALAKATDRILILPYTYWKVRPLYLWNMLDLESLHRVGIEFREVGFLHHQRVDLRTLFPVSRVFARHDAVGLLRERTLEEAVLKETPCCNGDGTVRRPAFRWFRYGGRSPRSDPVKQVEVLMGLLHGDEVKDDPLVALHLESAEYAYKTGELAIMNHVRHIAHEEKLEDSQWRSRGKQLFKHGDAWGQFLLLIDRILHWCHEGSFIDPSVWQNRAKFYYAMRAHDYCMPTTTRKLLTVPASCNGTFPCEALWDAPEEEITIVKGKEIHKTMV